MTARQSSASQPLLGSQSARFELVRLLGEGGMGVVHEALDRSTGRVVALKMLRDLDSDSRLRFKREFRALQGISHAQLVRFHELFEADGRLFFTMDLVHGRDLLAFVRKSDPSGSPGSAGDWNVDLHRLRLVLAQLVSAVAFLHEHDLIHRDIKPSNIVVRDDGSLTLLDFGLVTGDGVERSTGRYFLGTAAYMAPEQALGQAEAATDWYAVGVVLFQALTGRLPFEGPAAIVVTNKISHQAPRASSISPGVPQDLDELCTRLLQRDPQARLADRSLLDAVRCYVAAPAGASSRAPQTAAAFVGRTRERAWLHERYRRTMTGATATAYLYGESGIGKSTLVRQFLRELRDQPGMIALAGRCHERESIHYKGIDGVVDGLVAFLRGLPTEDAAAFVPRYCSELIKQFPAFAAVPCLLRAATGMRSLDLAQGRSHGILALRELFARLSDRYSLAVFIDDLQWIDADGENMLHELIRQPGAPPLFLVTTTASATPLGPEARRGLQALGAAPEDELCVGPLPASDARALVEAHASRYGLLVEPDVVEAVVEEADGNPILLFELMRHASGVRSQPSGSRSYRLNDVLGLRLAELPDTARRLLELACVAETRLSRDLALVALRLEASKLNDAVDLLTTQRFMLTPAGAEHSSLQPAHDRVRRAVLEGMTHDVLRGLHEQLAIALEQSGSSDDEALAMDWSRAGQPERAAPYAERAARAALGEFAFDRACALFRLALLGSRDPARQPGLYASLGEALASAGRSLEATKAFASAAEQTAEPHRQAELRRLAADQLFKAGHVDEGIEAMRAVLTPLGGDIAQTPRQALLSLLYHRARLALRGLRHRPRTESEIDPEVLHRVDVYWAVASGLNLVDLIRGADFQARCLILALDAGEPNRLARCVAIEAAVAASEGQHRLARAKEFLQRAEQLALQTGQRDVWAWVLLARGIVALQRGHFQACLDAVNEAERILLEECHGVSWQLARTRAFQIWALSYLGRVGELERRAGPLLRDYHERADLLAELGILTGPAHLLGLARDEAPAMRQSCEEALRSWSQRGFHLQHLSALFTLGVADLYEQAYARAHERVEGSWPEIEGSFLLRVEFVRIDAWYLRGRAALALAFVDRERAASGRKIVRLGIRSMERAGAGWGRGLMLILRAGLAQLEADAAAAATWLQQAAAALRETDMLLHAAACDYQAARLRGLDASQSEAALHGLGVKVPRRFAGALVPVGSVPD